MLTASKEWPRARVLAVMLVITAAATGCATTASIQWNPAPVSAAVPAEGPVFVMEPHIEGSASPGNVGRDFAAIQNLVLARTLAIVRERYPAADVAEPGPGLVAALPGYRQALGGQTVTIDEFNAARLARERGAAYLLIPSVTEWRAMRTDDPIGAFALRHNEVAVTLRLMRLQPPALVGRVTFVNHARVTLNQSPDRLLDAHFRTAVLRLLTGNSSTV